MDLPQGESDREGQYWGSQEEGLAPRWLAGARARGRTQGRQGNR